MRRGLREAAGAPSLLFTFAGIFLAIFVSLGTVYLGEQVLPLLFFLLGWAQAALATSTSQGVRPDTRHATASGAAAPRRPAFKHVIG